MQENNESTVNDNGVTYTPDHQTWIKGTVWSIGLGAEVQVVGHVSDQSEDVWLVTRDIDGDGSPDSALRRAGSDLAPLFKVGDVVSVFVQTETSVAPQLTYGLIITRGSRGVYLQTGYSMFTESGAVCIEWEDVRNRFAGGEEFQLMRNHTATLVSLLHSKVKQESQRTTEQETVADSLREELDQFKDDVARKMKALAVQHDWCDVAKRGLEDLGLDWPTTRWDVTVSMSGTVSISADSESEARERVQYLIDSASISHSGEGPDDDFDPSDLGNVEVLDVEQVDTD